MPKRGRTAFYPVIGEPVRLALEEARLTCRRAGVQVTLSALVEMGVMRLVNQKPADLVALVKKLQKKPG